MDDPPDPDERRHAAKRLARDPTGVRQQQLQQAIMAEMSLPERVTVNVPNMVLHCPFCSSFKTSGRTDPSSCRLCKRPLIPYVLDKPMMWRALREATDSDIMVERSEAGGTALSSKRMQTALDLFTNASQRIAADRIQSTISRMD